MLKAKVITCSISSLSIAVKASSTSAECLPILAFIHLHAPLSGPRGSQHLAEPPGKDWMLSLSSTFLLLLGSCADRGNSMGAEEAGDGEGLPQRSSRSGRGRGPRGDGRGRGTKGSASVDGGEHRTALLSMCCRAGFSCVWMQCLCWSSNSPCGMTSMSLPLDIL